MAVAALGTIPVFPAPGAFHGIDHPPERPSAGSSPVPATTFVPGGRFAVGSAWIDGRPVREAEVRPLRFGVSPVSNAAYAGFLVASGVAEPLSWRDPALSDPAQPVVGVTWFEAAAYCDWLHDTIGGHWRLPTEAEWEHAAVIVTGERDARPAGLRQLPLGRGAANGFGLMDVGSVHEWCRDWFTPDLLQRTRRYDPRGPEAGEGRVRRGASWRSGGWAASWRDGLEPAGRAVDGGFRVVREVP